MVEAHHSLLLIEDDRELGKQVVQSLEGEGFTVRWIEDGDTALGLSFDDYALVILDLMLPGAYGLDVLKELRRVSDVPVLILSARNESQDKVRGFALGADDFVTKPFWPEELIARVHARLRRPLLQHADAVLECGALALDLEARSLRVAGAEVALTAVEFDLLAVLARRAGAAVARSELVDQVLDPAGDGNERTLDVHFSRLRKKLGTAAGQVRTVWGVGYRLEDR